MRTIHIITALATIALVSCTNKDENPDTGSDTPDTQPPEDTGPEEVRPTIQTGTWQCAGGDAGPDQIIVQVEADDPQGDETLDPFGGIVELYQGSGSLDEAYEMICNDDGSCSGSFDANDAGVSQCGNGKLPSRVGKATVTDEDGNISEPCTLTWLDSP